MDIRKYWHLRLHTMQTSSESQNWKNLHREALCSAYIWPRKYCRARFQSLHVWPFLRLRTSSWRGDSGEQLQKPAEVIRKAYTLALELTLLSFRKSPVKPRFLITLSMLANMSLRSSGS